MVCAYCFENYDDPMDFRQHMKEEHNSFKVNTAFRHAAKDYQEYLKVDCTELGCRICLQKFEDLPSITMHLVEMHSKNINLNAEVGMQIFKLGEERWVCVICGTKFPTLRSLSRHMSSHSGKNTCKICGKSYMTQESLKRHRLDGHTNVKICMRCKKTFPDSNTRNQHMMESPYCWRLACPKCDERFYDPKSKREHLANVHNEQKSYPCPECGEVFEEYLPYRSHFVTKHTNNFECTFCGRKFERKSCFDQHILTHTKEKFFSCTICQKSFSRKNNLVQHMWVHSEQKRFSCELCNKQFNQPIRWRIHMRNHHPDFLEIQ